MHCELSIIDSRQVTMLRSLTKSNQHFQKALTRLPLGVSSNFRYWGDEKTIYVDHAHGARLWDLDGNEYIDYRMGYGPGILGYADPRVDKAARKGMETGGVFALSTEIEYEVASRISKMVPAAELVRFSNSGTEAVMAALRLARAYTGKDSHVIVEGGYHLSACLASEYHYEHKRAVKDMPLDKLLLETDTPVHYQGHMAMPSDTLRALSAVCEIKELDMQEVADGTTANARQLFGLD